MTRLGAGGSLPLAAAALPHRHAGAAAGVLPSRLSPSHTAATRRSEAACNSI